MQQERTSGNQGSTPQEEDYSPAIVLKEEGEKYDGVLDHYSEGPSKFDPNATVPIAVLRNVEGELGSLWLGTVLKAKFARLRPKVGERVVVVCKGMREGASGSYRDFSVTMPDRPPYVPDWDSMDTGEDWGTS